MTTVAVAVTRRLLALRYAECHSGVDVDLGSDMGRMANDGVGTYFGGEEKGSDGGVDWYVTASPKSRES